jgi:hypothetical protein
MKFYPFILMMFLIIACKTQVEEHPELNQKIKDKVDDFAEFKLETDLSVLSDKEMQMLPLLFEAADIMNTLFWKQAYGDKENLLKKYQKDEFIIDFIKINYGPWERLNGNKPFLPGYGDKPAGANFYPTDMTKEEFEALDDESKNSLYTLIRRDNQGNLKVIPYHEAYQPELERAAGLLRKAAELAEDEGLKKYLRLRADALITDEFLKSDMAWMDMRDNTIDFVVGPIENYEDQLFGIKTAYEAYILIKDKEWSKRLQMYAEYLPELQSELPVDEKYKQETPGSDSDLGAYDAVYYAGDCNAGSKTIAINLPNDERVHLEKGSRRLQLKNSMRAKFDKILVPISKELVVEDQQKNVTFDAFFENTMFHEVAHGLGIKETVSGKGKVRTALKDMSTTIEEGKADILGLFMVTKLNEKELLETNLMNNYVTFVAGIFRSIRFGASSSHGRANLIRYNYFKEKEAFEVTDQGKIRIHFEKMQKAMYELSNEIITIQGEGDYQAAKNMFESMGKTDQYLDSALERVNSKDIPLDVVFKQGPKVLGVSE